MIGNDRGGGKETVRSSGGRSFQKRGAVLDNDSAIIMISLVPLVLFLLKG